MAYASQADLVPLRITQKELVELTDDAKTGAVNTALVTAALEEASGKVDSYCRNRYTTPLQASDSVKGLTLDIATWLLFSRRRNMKMNETIQSRYAEAMKFLNDISTGKAQLDQPVGEAPQGSGAGPVVASSGDVPVDTDARFRDDHLKGFC
jgi:phage gp36-like protein